MSARPDIRAVGIVFYLSAAFIVLSLIGEFPYAGDFYMGMATLPFLVSGWMLASRWWESRR